MINFAKCRKQLVSYIATKSGRMTSLDQNTVTLTTSSAFVSWILIRLLKNILMKIDRGVITRVFNFPPKIVQKQNNSVKCCCTSSRLSIIANKRLKSIRNANFGKKRQAKATTGTQLTKSMLIGLVQRFAVTSKKSMERSWMNIITRPARNSFSFSILDEIKVKLIFMACWLQTKES